MESGCARLHVVSTGNGADDAFAALYENAVAGRGAYQTLFIPSDADPRRDASGTASMSRRRPTPTVPAVSTPAASQDAFRSARGGLLQALLSFERHVAEIAIVANWRTWRGIDFGLRHPACLWAQRSPAGQLFVVDELLPRT